MTVKEHEQAVKIYKIGGNVINNQENLDTFLQAFSSIEGYKILVHGGGKVADEYLAKLDINPVYIHGRRITDEATMEVVQMTYAGLINKNIVAHLQQLGCNALGLTGADANIIQAMKRPVKDVDFGMAGDIENIESEKIIYFLKGNLVPVFCALTHDSKGNMLNTNADTITAQLGVAMASEFRVSLIYCFEKPGVLRDINDETSYYREFSYKMYKESKEKNKLKEGILPKLHNAFEALEKGVDSVWITASDAVAQEKPSGTRILL